MVTSSAGNRSWSFECLIEWLKIREQEGKAFPHSLPELISEVDHSALLQRLITGKRALPSPPPLSFSYPWYDLLEKGYAHPVEVFTGDRLTKDADGDRVVVINQYPWKIIEQNSDEDFIITYGDNNPMYRMSMSGIGSEETGQAKMIWKLQRLDTSAELASSNR